MENNEKKVILSLRNVEVKFNVRGRILTAIRNVSLDIYEHESLAIVGESGSGKSVLTKTFAGMLDSNGFIPQGSIIFSDDELSTTDIKLTPKNKRTLERIRNMLNKNSVLERGATEYKAIVEQQNKIKYAKSLTLDEQADFATRLKAVTDDIVDQNNYLWTLDKKADAELYARTTARIKSLNEQKDKLEAEKTALVKQRAADYSHNTDQAQKDKARLAELMATREKKIATPDTEGNPYGLSNAVLERNKIIANEVLLSIGRYPIKDQMKFLGKLNKAFKLAMSLGEDLKDPAVLNKIFEVVTFRVEYRSYDEDNETLHGYAIIDCAKIKYTNDWQQIRGRRIATVFQDPMTSLNPVIPIGKQIMT
ncbi:MAG: ATP-binding cassette domain-containing protein, partial [Oscillospiraceae bacterium]|nr:ATP-binding cassette domain-containing protein [Oscillospiraceae bacterium]